MEPKREFIRISKEDNKPLNIFLNYILPFLVVYALITYIGKIIYSADNFNDGLGLLIKNTFLIICLIIIGTYIASISINELLPAFKLQKSLNKTFALVAYSFTPVYIAIIFSSLIPNLSNFIYLIGLYSIILFWISASAITDIKKEQRQIFIPISLLFIILIFLLVWIILGLLFLL